MNNRLTSLVVVIAVFSEPFTVHAYELGTHARMTYKAYEQSALKQDDKLIKDLGIDLSNPNNPFGTVYYDISGTEVSEREASTFEAGHMDDSENPYPVIPIGTDPRSLPGWLLRGAIREDDVLEPDNGQPVEDPYNTGNPLLDNRVLNHFYDPVHNMPLTVGIVLGKKAPDWASGTSNVFSQPNTPESHRRNHFTVFDAREVMYRALTGKTQDNTDAGPNNQPATKEDRDKYWVTLFRALGDIVHLIQDMGQPQHTRNDPHAGKKYDGNPGVRGHKSLYEAYIDTRAAAKEFESSFGDKFIPPPLNYTGYDTPRFTDYLSYFTTRQVDSDVMARRGLADYSNRGFFSAGQNLNPSDARYDYPSNNAPSYDRLPVETNWLGDPFGGTMTLFIGTVTDSLTGQTATNVPLTAIGAWDAFLEQKNLLSRYTLVRENYDAQANLLIPRAVAYSAGMIDHFFRGRIEAEDAHYTDTMERSPA